MFKNIFHFLYAEIISLFFIAIVSLTMMSSPFGQKLNKDCSDLSGFNVPYVSIKFDQLCKFANIPFIINLYFCLSIIVIILFQIIMIINRGKIKIVNYKLFIIFLIFLIFILTKWIIGSESILWAYNASIHKGHAIFPIMITISIPSIQFILNMMLLSGSNDRERFNAE